MRAFRIPLLAASCGLAVLYFGIGLQASNPRLIRDWPDLLRHGGPYLFLAVSFALTLQAWGVRRWLWAGFFAALAHGLLLEIAQSWTSTRKADPVDFLGDLIGAGIGCFLLSLLGRRRT